MTTNRLLLLALFVYLALLPWFFHPDLKVIFSLASKLSTGVVDIYGYVAANPTQSTTGPFVYPPLAYFILGTLYLPLRLVAGSDFMPWLFSGNTNVVIPNIFLFITLLKLPFLCLHLVIAKMLYDYSHNTKAVIFWLFNPLSLYVVAIVGQIDLLAILATVVSLKTYKFKPITSVIALGLGAAIKSFPLLLLPFLILYLSHSWPRRVGYLMLGLATYLLFIVPFLRQPAFFDHTFTSGLTQRLFSLHLPGLALPAVPMALLVVWLSLAFSNRRPALHLVFLSVLLIVVASLQLHPQWLLWALPFLSLVTLRWRLLSLGYIGFGLLQIFIIPDNFLTVNLIAPLLPAVLELPTLVSMLPNLATSGLGIVATIGFASTCLLICFKSLYAKT